MRASDFGDGLMWGECGFVTYGTKRTPEGVSTRQNGAIGVYGRHPVYIVLGGSWVEGFCEGDRAVIRLFCL